MKQTIDQLGSNQQILITGSSGFIGSALCNVLQNSNIRFDRIVRKQATTNHKSDCTFKNDTLIVDWPDGLKDLDLTHYSMIIHLATPNNSEASIDDYLAPLQRLNHAILRDNPSCHLICLSSLSASRYSSSNYGRGKWAMEDYLINSVLQWTLLKPGLVVDLASPRGLFGAIYRSIKLLPIIPVPDGEGVMVQPVMLDDVIGALLKIIESSVDYSSQILNLALPARSLVHFTQDIAIERGIRRWILPFPVSLSLAILRAIQTIIPQFPIKAANLQGLLCGGQVNSSDSEERLGTKLTNIGMSQINHSTDDYLSWEARYLFRKIFQMSPSKRVINRYIDAHRTIAVLDCNDIISVYELIKNGYSIEMVERANRSRYPNIAAKFLILSYLAEVDPQYHDLFIIRKTSRAKGWFRLVLGVLKTVAALLYGKLTYRSISELSIRQSK